MKKLEFNIDCNAENTVLVTFGNTISETTNSQIRAFCKSLEQIMISSQVGASSIIEYVPTYCSVTIYYDSQKISVETAKNIIQLAIEKSYSMANDEASNTIEIPVCYEGDFAPDLHDVAEHTGMTEQEVIDLHSSTIYPVYMLGFLPGFPYLGGMDKKLVTPRLKTPRTKIPAGSVAIGGEQTGIYPLDSPGGWRIIGRTPVKLYDSQRNPPILFKAGDKIKFIPISKKEYDKYESEQKTNTASSSKKETYAVSSGFSVISSGMMTTVQDAGRFGFLKDGVSSSGAMDFLSFAAANIIVGNPKDFPVLETTLLGPSIKFSSDADFAITGATISATLNGQSINLYQKIHAVCGDVLECGAASNGLRSYLAFHGGIVVPKVMGSCSTNTKCALGGYFGRKLQVGDELLIGYLSEKKCKKGETKTFDFSMLNTNSNVAQTEIQPIVLRVVDGPQKSMFDSVALKTFESSVYSVTVESDRMGLRLSGEKIVVNGGTDIISDCVINGAIQITSLGMPVILTADRQTTGGYAKIATVITADLPYLAQALPGTKVKFKFVSRKEALELFQKQQEKLKLLESI